jgi:acetyl esterase/lipase
MRRRPLVLLVIGLISLVAAGCVNPIATPVGPAPLRYRDQIFTAVTTTTNVVYGHAVDQNNVNEALTLDVYRPTGDTVTSRPAVIWVHGGGFSGGDKTSVELVDEANTLVMKGYVAFSINYRLAPQGCVGTVTASCVTGIVQALQDAQTAVRFVREQAATYGVDPNRIAMGGSSAGAITALNVGYNGDNPGPGDHQGFSSRIGAAQSLSGAALPPGAISTGDAPALLFHGTADPLVPYAWAQSTVSAAQAAHDVALLRTWPGDGHVPYVQHRTQILDETTNFFYSQMDLAHAAR